MLVIGTDDFDYMTEVVTKYLDGRRALKSQGADQRSAPDSGKLVGAEDKPADISISERYDKNLDLKNVGEAEDRRKSTRST